VIRVQNIIKRPGVHAERVLMGGTRGAIARELGTAMYVCALEIPRAILVEWDPAVGYDLLCLTPKRQPTFGPINFLRFGDREPIRTAAVWVRQRRQQRPSKRRRSSRPALTGPPASRLATSQRTTPQTCGEETPDMSDLKLRLPDSLRAAVLRRVPKPRPVEGETAGDLAKRAERDPDRQYSASQAIRGSLARYYEVCRRHLARLDLSREELAVVCDVLNGGLLGWEDDHSAARISVVWSEVADAFALGKGYGERHGVSDEQGRQLVAKLQAASYADLVALVDFVERFWSDDEEANRAVGHE
jgi:hypothetical protein